MTGLLKVSRDPTAGLLAGFAVLPAAAWLLPAGTVLLALAESAEWFGVQPRRRWHSLLREGGWLLAVSLVLYGVMLAPLARH